MMLRAAPEPGSCGGFSTGTADGNGGDDRTSGLTWIPLVFSHVIKKRPELSCESRVALEIAAATCYLPLVDDGRFCSLQKQVDWCLIMTIQNMEKDESSRISLENA